MEEFLALSVNSRWKHGWIWCLVQELLALTMCLQVAASCTLPVPAPYVVQMLGSSPHFKASCFFPLPGRVRFAKNWTRIIDVTGDEIIRLQLRVLKRTKDITDKSLTKDIYIYGFTRTGETLVLGQLLEN